MSLVLVEWARILKGMLFGSALRRENISLQVIICVLVHQSSHLVCKVSDETIDVDALFLFCNYLHTQCGVKTSHYRVLILHVTVYLPTQCGVKTSHYPVLILHVTVYSPTQCGVKTSHYPVLILHVIVYSPTQCGVKTSHYPVLILHVTVYATLHTVDLRCYTPSA